ncbi:hypothetical protein C1645_765006 [Glomus cerebriforme]|uniref:DUF4097 domain-containing protein n=1 Tax=Glomus cerebriforme TaxID=658196 RepID=A0A397T2W0_9GLOM|nr:hypothetical protein C1645_765006 [Glomus cerebriforme]
MSNNQENNKNDNDNQDSKNDISKILEEGSATIAPPPAYDEISKPPPTYPPPPSFPPPASENYNQSPYIVPANSTNSNNVKRERQGCCSGPGPRRNKTCCCCWIIFLIIFIFGTISVVNNSACNKITLGGNPSGYSFDSSVNSIFQINVDEARIRDGEVRIFQQSPQTQAANTVNINVYSGSSGTTPKIDTSSQNDIFELKISQPGFRLFNIPPRCMKLLIDVFLPQTLDPNTPTFPITIKVKNLDLTMEQNTFPYQQNITLITDNGDMQLNNVIAQSMSIKTDNGDITGSITSISNEFDVSTDNGGLELTLGNIQNPFVSKATINTNNGDVILKFDGSSFSGNYNIQSNDGRIRIDNNTPTNRIGNQIIGTAGNGTGNLKINTDNGDIYVVF